MSAITLGKVVEAMTSGLADLDYQVEQYDKEIKKLEVKRAKAREEAGHTRQAVNAMLALQASLGESETITLRFPSL